MDAYLKKFIDDYQHEIANNIKVQKKIDQYLINNKLTYSGTLLFWPSIDVICVYIDSLNNDPVLFINLLDDYKIEETEYARLFLTEISA